ncbi:hypothetical protein MTO96_050113 [Rhipicephalus appendiculatus]
MACKYFPRDSSTGKYAAHHQYEHQTQLKRFKHMFKRRKERICINRMSKGDWTREKTSREEPLCPSCESYAATVFAFPCGHLIGCAYCFANRRVTSDVPRCTSCHSCYSYAYYEHRYALSISDSKTAACDPTFPPSSTDECIVMRRVVPTLETPRWVTRTLFLAEPYMQHVCGIPEFNSTYGWVRTLAFVYAMECKSEAEFPFRSRYCDTAIPMYTLHDVADSLTLPSVLCCDGNIANPNTYVRVPLVTESGGWIKMPLYRYAHLCGLICAYYSKLMILINNMYPDDLRQDWPPTANPIEFILTHMRAKPSPPSSLSSSSTEKDITLSLINTMAYYCETTCQDDRAIQVAAAITAAAFAGYNDIVSKEHVLLTTSGGALHIAYAALCIQALRETWCASGGVDCKKAPGEVVYSSRKPIIVYNRIERTPIPMTSMIGRIAVNEFQEFSVDDVEGIVQPSFSFLSACRIITRRYLPVKEEEQQCSVTASVSTTTALEHNDLVTAYTRAMLNGCTNNSTSVEISNIPDSHYANEIAFRAALKSIYGKYPSYFNALVEYVFGRDTERPGSRRMHQISIPKKKAGCGYERLVADALKRVVFQRGWNRSIGGGGGGDQQQQQRGRSTSSRRYNVDNDVEERTTTKKRGDDRQMRYPETVVLSDPSQLRTVVKRYLGLDDTDEHVFNPTRVITDALNSQSGSAKIMDIVKSMNLSFQPTSLQRRHAM